MAFAMRIIVGVNTIAATMTARAIAELPQSVGIPRASSNATNIPANNAARIGQRIASSLWAEAMNGHPHTRSLCKAVQLHTTRRNNVQKSLFYSHLVDFCAVFVHDCCGARDGPPHRTCHDQQAIRPVLPRL